MNRVRGSHLEWDGSKADKYAEKWWAEHGYAFELKKRYQTKSTYTVQKGDISCNYDIFSTEGRPQVADEVTQMKTFERDFEAMLELASLRQQVNELRGK